MASKWSRDKGLKIGGQDDQLWIRCLRASTTSVLCHDSTTKKQSKQSKQRLMRYRSHSIVGVIMSSLLHCSTFSSTLVASHLADYAEVQLGKEWGREREACLVPFLPPSSPSFLVSHFPINRFFNAKECIYIFMGTRGWDASVARRMGCILSKDDLPAIDLWDGLVERITTCCLGRVSNDG